MSDFFRFPHTPHLKWLGQGTPRDDKVLSGIEAAKYLDGHVVVQEKIDGANIGISIEASGELRVQNRGQYLSRPYGGQFARLNAWLDAHRDTFAAALDEDWIVFGEWCAAKHSIAYTGLPDWFLVFDVYDRNQAAFWSAPRVERLADKLSLYAVPVIFQGAVTFAKLEKLLDRTPSQFGAPTIEGLVVRRESSEWVQARAKLVHPRFTQQIDEHWRRRRLEWNHMAHRG